MRFLEVVQEKILRVLKESDTPLITTEIARKVEAAPATTQLHLERLRSRKIVFGRQTKKRGPWVWWLPQHMVVPAFKESFEHTYLKTEMAKELEKQGHIALFEQTIEGCRYDVLAQKEGKLVGVECITDSSSLHSALERLQKYQQHVDEVYFALPKGLAIDFSPPPGVKVSQIEIPFLESTLQVEEREETGETVVTRKGQITIPAKFRVKYGIEEGTRLEVIETEEGILFKPKESTIDLAGSGAKYANPGEMKKLLDKLREEDV